MEERGRPVVRFPEARRGQRQPPQNQHQAPQTNVVLVEMTELPQMQEDQKSQPVEHSGQVAQVFSNCDPQCDCSSCVQIEDCEDSQAMAVTRAKGKAVMQWDEQEKVRERVAG